MHLPLYKGSSRIVFFVFRDFSFGTRYPSCSMTTVIFMNAALAFAKALKSCVVLKFSCFTFQKVAFYNKQLLIVLPNAYIIYLVSKEHFLPLESANKRTLKWFICLFPQLVSNYWCRKLPLVGGSLSQDIDGRSSRPSRKKKGWLEDTSLAPT